MQIRSWWGAVALTIAFASVAMGWLVFREGRPESTELANAAGMPPSAIASSAAGTEGDPSHSEATSVVAALIADILIEAAENPYWTAEFRGRIARLPLKQQAKIVTHPALQGRLDASRWANRLMSCGGYLRAASRFVHPTLDNSDKWQQAWCADLSDDPGGWRERLAEATHTYAEAMRATDPWGALDNLEPKSVVTELTQMLRSDDLEIVAMGVQQVMFLHASAGIGIEAPPHEMTDSLEEANRFGASAAALIACQSEGYCGWRSPWLGEYCAIFADECLPGAPLNAQISRNESEVRIEALRKWVAAMLRFRNGP